MMADTRDSSRNYDHLEEVHKKVAEGWENTERRPDGKRKAVFNRQPEKPDEQRYRRSKNKRGKFLDYSKVDWEALANELEGQPYGGKRPILIKWAMRLKCSIDTLYRGLRMYRNDEIT